jgi:3-deoxy-D-manno-octulosonate 8-phosphate phosphatase (KDO 8-P phosphatase)
MQVDLMAKAKQIKLLILDVDGVMSDGRIIVTDSGDEIKAFHVQDGLGIQFLLESGLQVAVITGRDTPSVTARIKKLKIPFLYQGQLNKIQAFEELLAKLHLKPEQTAHIGDDLPDIALFKRVGLAIAVPNAVPLAKEYAHWVTEASGGLGAIREVCDLLLKAQDLWPAIEKRFIC